MKIGVICYPSHGGSGVVATSIGHAMVERGHDVHIISYATPFRFQSYMPRLHLHEVEVSAYPLFRYPPYDVALANKILEVVENEGLDLIHAHYAVPHAVSAHMARGMLAESGIDLKLVTTLHGTDVTIVGQERGYQRITRHGIAKSDAVTSVSHYLKAEAARLLDIDCSTIRVIHNFVDTERFHTDCCPERRAMMALPDEKIVMHISNFREVKRPLDTIEALARVPKELNARLVMIGDGPLVRVCKERAHKLGLAEKVRFIGTVDTPWELLPQADAFILPSDTESFGLAALEAMSCGVPVVASNAGGLPEVVEDGKSGYLVEVGDVDTYAQRLTDLLDDDTHRAAMSEAARKRAVEHFGMDPVMDQWEAFYREVIG